MYYAILSIALVALIVLAGVRAAFRVAVRLRRVENFAGYISNLWRNVVAPVVLLLGVAIGFICSLVACAFFANIFGIIVWLVFVSFAIDFWRRKRANRAVAFMQTLTIAVENEMPLGPTIEAFAREFGGYHAQLAAERVRQGRGLAEVIAEAKNIAPFGAPYMIRIGDATDSMSKALRRFLDRKNEWFALVTSMFVGLSILLFAVGIMTFTIIKVIPSFKKISVDFGMKLPLPTQILIQLSDLLAPSIILLVFALFAFAVFCLLRNWGALTIEIPGEGKWLTGASRKADVLESLILAAENNRPFERALAVLGKSYPYVGMRRRLQQAQLFIDRGESWIDALLKSGVLSQAEAEAVRSGERTGNLAWVLESLAERNRRLIGRRVKKLRGVLFSSYIVAGGFMATLVATSVFSFLVKIIDGLVAGY